MSSCDNRQVSWLNLTFSFRLQVILLLKSRLALLCRLYFSAFCRVSSYLLSFRFHSELVRVVVVVVYQKKNRRSEQSQEILVSQFPVAWLPDWKAVHALRGGGTVATAPLLFVPRGEQPQLCPGDSQSVTARIANGQSVTARITNSQSVTARITNSQSVTARITVSQSVTARITNSHCSYNKVSQSLLV